MCSCLIMNCIAVIWSCANTEDITLVRALLINVVKELKMTSDARENRGKAVMSNIASARNQ